MGPFLSPSLSDPTLSLAQGLEQREDERKTSETNEVEETETVARRQWTPLSA